MKTVFKSLVIAVLVLACAKEAPRFSVLLVGIDTLRPDHLSCYGYHRLTSPNIDGLASEGVLFENCISQCPWTLPSFASLLTSLYPTQHGAGINMSKMGTDFPTLGVILAEEGYTTGAVLSSRVLSPEFGVARGFQYYNINSAGEDRDARAVTDSALAWLDGLGERPFFLFVHYFDPHLPYSPPAPYDTLFDVRLRTSIGSSFDLRPLLEKETALKQQLAAMTAGDWSRVVSLYDGEVAYTDAAIGRLLDGLRDRGLARNTLVVLLSDHGEEFYEHGGLGHGHTLFNEVIRVPLILSLSGALPCNERVNQQVRMVDVLPTVLEILALECDQRFEGVSRFGLVKGGSGVSGSSGSLFPAHIAYSEGLRRGSERKGVSAYPWKLIYDTDKGSDLVFNLARDPGEIKSMTGELPEPVSLMKDVLERNLIRMTDTWYVEMVPGPAACEFGLHVSVEEDLSRGSITFCRYIGEDGAVLQPYGVRIEHGRLVIEGLLLEEPMTLAFQVEAPPGLPVAFDLSVNGESATGQTYLGAKMLEPDSMPFSLHARWRGLKAVGSASVDRNPPYFLVRRSDTKKSVRAAARLGAETREELRALGYIQ